MESLSQTLLNLKSSLHDMPPLPPFPILPGFLENLKSLGIQCNCHKFNHRYKSEKSKDQKEEPKEEIQIVGKENFKDLDQWMTFINDVPAKRKTKKGKKKKKIIQEEKEEIVTPKKIEPTDNNPKINTNVIKNDIDFEDFKKMILRDTIKKNKIHKIRPEYPKEWLEYINSL